MGSTTNLLTAKTGETVLMCRLARVFAGHLCGKAKKKNWCVYGRPTDPVLRLRPCVFFSLKKKKIAVDAGPGRVVPDFSVLSCTSVCRLTVHPKWRRPWLHPSLH